jgi:hypothetical protein
LHKYALLCSWQISEVSFPFFFNCIDTLACVLQMWRRMLTKSPAYYRIFAAWKIHFPFLFKRKLLPYESLYRVRLLVKKSLDKEFYGTHLVCHSHKMHIIVWRNGPKWNDIWCRPLTWNLVEVSSDRYAFICVRVYST